MDSKEIYLPDEAIRYIMNGYLLKRHTEGVPVVLGISQETVEAVLQLFIDWSVTNKHLNEGVLNFNSITTD